MSDTCKYASLCGGCEYSGVDYKEQLRIKQKNLNKLLGAYGKVNPIIGMEKHDHYRCKVNAEYAYTKSGRYISGVYEKNSHRVVAIDSCNITNDIANGIIVSIRDMLKSFKIKTYNEDTGYGLLRHVQVRIGYYTGEVMVILICSSPTFPSKNNFIKALLKEHPEITTIILNVNNKKTSMVVGDRNIILYGKGYIEDRLCGLTFRISPGSFYQVNPVMTEILYNKALEYASFGKDDTILDAYSGTGTIGLIASKNVKNVISVELSKDAHRDAIVNSKLNGIKNVRFYQSDATEFIERLASDNAKIDCIIMDPPRSGSTKRFINAVSKLSPQKVVYISCGPESLARDLKDFTMKGFKIEQIQPVDLFVDTKHIETVCLLSRKR